MTAKLADVQKLRAALVNAPMPTARHGSGSAVAGGKMLCDCGSMRVARGRSPHRS